MLGAAVAGSAIQSPRRAIRTIAVAWSISVFYEGYYRSSPLKDIKRARINNLVVAAPPAALDHQTATPGHPTSVMRSTSYWTLRGRVVLPLFV